jgi:hypothetical protein
LGLTLRALLPRSQARESYFSGHPTVADEMFDRVEARPSRAAPEPRCAHPLPFS